MSLLHSFVANKYNSTTDELDLSGLHMDTTDVTSIHSVVYRNMDSIKSLNISHNYICAEGIKKLFLNLTHSNISLLELDISYNPLGPSCIDIIGNYIRNNSKLRRFHANSCNLGPKGAKMLSHFLYNHPSLQSVSLCMNSLDDASVIDLLIALKTCPALVTIHLFTGNNITTLTRNCIDLMQINVTDNM